MRWLHEALLKEYPDKEFYINLNTDPNEVKAWDGTTFVDFTYDSAKVNAAHDSLIIEHQWQELREERDRLLAETDWMANSDVTLADAWKTYRKNLRDLPANTADPANPTWPTKPT